MCHAVLPTGPDKKRETHCGNYLDCVIEKMINTFSQYRIPARTLTTKVFGGAKMLDQNSPLSASQPGHTNIEMAKRILREYECNIFVPKAVMFT